MNDDWRLRVDLHDADHAHHLTTDLQARELEHDLATSFHDRVIVSRDGAEVFCYAATRDQDEAAERLIRRLASSNGWQATFELKHWHPAAERWEDPDKPLPAGDAARSAEHAALIREEREESERHGYPDWEVRVHFRSHQDALALSHRLRAEGIPHLHRWRYVVVGADDEDSARRLGERIQAESPPGSEAIVEGSAKAAEAAMPRNPFAVFGGLGV